MSHHRVLQYEFLLDGRDQGPRFVVRTYLSYRVLRFLRWRTRLVLIRRFSDPTWFEDLLPRQAGEWLWRQFAGVHDEEKFRQAMLEYLTLYVQQPDREACPLAFENRSRQFLAASQEERFFLSLLIGAKQPFRFYLFAPNYIMAPTQIFLMSA